MARRSLNVGMIGYNFMGKAHSNAWRQAPKFFELPADVALHTICGRSSKNVETAREQLGWKSASTDWKAVVSDPEIDIIDICTPNDSHCEIALEAAGMQGNSCGNRCMKNENGAASCQANVELALDSAETCEHEN